MSLITSFISGLIFALGLGLSGMMNPQKVISFLDITGTWDPSLAFVMIGAIGVASISFIFILPTKQKPILEKVFSLPTKKEIDWKLITGSAIFGVGWAIGGICPGPAIANLSLFSPQIISFIIAMLLGIFSTKILKK